MITNLNKSVFTRLFVQTGSSAWHSCSSTTSSSFQGSASIPVPRLSIPLPLLPQHCIYASVYHTPLSAFHWRYVSSCGRLLKVQAFEFFILFVLSISYSRFPVNVFIGRRIGQNEASHQITAVKIVHDYHDIQWKINNCWMSRTQIFFCQK